MRIISDDKDYYDCVMRMGFADDLVYIRKQRELLLPKSPFPRHRNNYAFRGNLNLYSRVIGFCGKIYGVLEGTYPTSTGTCKVVCHNMEEVDFVAERSLKKKDLKTYKEGKISAFFATGRGSYLKFFSQIEEKQDSFKDFFHEHSCAIFVANPSHWDQKSRKYVSLVTINGLLKGYEFYRILDPYTAFQELQMYVANMASPEKPIPHVSDADMLEAKGFDPRWSFRKEPTKKGKKRG